MQINSLAPIDRPELRIPRNLKDANRDVGRFKIRYYDREDGVAFTAYQQFVSGTSVGARVGYENLRDAIMSLAIETHGDTQPAAVIFERDGRYYGRSLKMRDLASGSKAPMKPLHLEGDEHISVRELRIADSLHDRARAIVDGAWVHKFRPRAV